MRTNLSIKVLSLLLAGVMAFGLASCKDDELEPDPSPDVNITPPTEDVVKTTIDKSYAVIGTDFDEVTPYVMKRMTGQRYDYTRNDSYIADDVRVVFLDTKSLTGISEGMAYQVKKVFDCGGFIYLHKPNALAIAFLHMFVNEELDDFMEWMEENMGGGQTRTEQDGDPLTRDSYILSLNCSLDMADIYNGREVTRETTIIEVDENGKEHTRTVTESFTPGEPTDYEYGLFAESVARWMNEDSPITRANDDTDKLRMPHENFFVMPCRIQRKGDDKVITANAEIKIRTASLYSPQEDEDFYYITTEQMVPVEAFSLGTYYEKKGYIIGNETRKATGYTWSSNRSFLPVMATEGYHATFDNLQPLDRGPVAEYVSVDGWAAGSDICMDNNTVDKLQSSYRPEILAMPVAERFDGFAFETSTVYGDNYWLYFTKEEDNYYTEYFLSPSHPNHKNAVTRQSFTCRVKNTKQRGSRPFELNLQNRFRFHGAWVNGSSISERTFAMHEYVVAYQGTITYSLPVPNRFVSNHTIVPDEKYSDWDALEALLKSCPKYKKLAEEQYCDAAENSLEVNLAYKWIFAKEELAKKKLDFSFVKNNYIIRLFDGKGKEVGAPLYISPKGMNIWVKGSFYMSDGSFLPPHTKLTEEQKKNCVGIVCVLGEKFPHGINGYAVALHDANQTPCAWGDPTYFKNENILMTSRNGAGYENTHYLLMTAAEKDGKKPSEEWYPALYHALNYPVANPKSNKGWFLPSRYDLQDAFPNINSNVMDESLREAGGEPIVPSRIYATSTLYYSDYSMFTVVRKDEGTAWAMEYHNPEEEKFYVRPFIAF